MASGLEELPQAVKEVVEARIRPLDKQATECLTKALQKFNSCLDNGKAKYPTDMSESLESQLKQVYDRVAYVRWGVLFAVKRTGEDLKQLSETLTRTHEVIAQVMSQ